MSNPIIKATLTLIGGILSLLYCLWGLGGAAACPLWLNITLFRAFWVAIIVISWLELYKKFKNDKE